MKYAINSNSTSKKEGVIIIKQSDIVFGITPESTDIIANPAELFLGALSACILKSLERFSTIMNFEYSNAEIIVKAVRKDKPPRMDEIKYELTIYTQDNNLNINLLKRNIEKYGTIFNTVKTSCAIIGEVKMVSQKKN